MRLVLALGGAINLLFAVAHLTLPSALGWEESLGSLSADDRSMMYIFNYIVAYVLAAFAYVSVFHWRSLSSTGLGKAVSGMTLGFWLVRAAEEVVFSGLAQAGAWTMVVLCLAIGGLYAVPIVRGERGGQGTAAVRS